MPIPIFWENIQKELAEHELSIAKGKRRDFQTVGAVLPKLNKALDFKMLTSRGNEHRALFLHQKLR